MTEKQLEEEAQDEAEVLEERAAPTMAAALVKLTEVLAAMQGRNSRSSLEETLDGASLSSLGGFGGGGGEGLSGGKKNLRLLLRKALREQPEYFSNYMEKALRDSVRDFVAPSTSTRVTALGGRIPARTYLQTKARIAGHRPTQFWSWQVAALLWGVSLPIWWIHAACAGARGRGNPSLRVFPTTRGSWEFGSALEYLTEPYLGQHSPSASSRDRELDGETKEACRGSRAKSWNLRRWSCSWQWWSEGESGRIPKEDVKKEEK
ncbi:unnamed protein product [Polarella glacialis]|uniref:Uncharacterized protein n=1 Tax=Polarella glacialis TaxID=89957 RepID=A0A813LJ44_POLGL|nr:unnamed protein product [Polarella glacialis]